MARKFIVVSGVDGASIARNFSECGKAPRANICPRMGSLRAALEYAKGWPEAGYCAAIFSPLKGGGWGLVEFMEP